VKVVQFVLIFAGVFLTAASILAQKTAHPSVWEWCVTIGAAVIVSIIVFRVTMKLWR